MDATGTGGRDVFGARLREHRLAAGLTQEALAERAGLGVRTIQALEAGRSRPRRETVRRLARALELSEEQRTRLAVPAPRASRVARRAGVAAGLEARGRPVAPRDGTGITGMDGAADGASPLAAPPPLARPRAPGGRGGGPASPANGLPVLWAREPLGRCLL